MTRSTEVIEDEIERTRSRIDARLDGLGAELNPARLIESVLGTSGGSTTDTLSAVTHKARQNPLSAILVGAGLVGLFLADRNEHSSTPVNQSDREPGEHTAEDSMVGDPAQQVSRHITDLKRDVTTGIEDGIDTVRETVSETREKAGEKISQARAAVADSTRNAPVVARARAETAVEWVKDNPLPAGLIAVAAGATIASLFSVRNANSATSRMQASRQLHETAEQEVRTPQMRAKATKSRAKPESRSSSSSKTAAVQRPVSKPKRPKTVSTKSAKRSLESGESLIRSTATLGEKPAGK